ncbi:MAG: isoprenylcysteine carboxylmethyltransferase family protein [Terriglobia bacterium]|jgi:protein-S-isoprenylcysteine O-methyltransferase Ste14
MDKNYAAWAARWRVPLGFAMAIALVILSQPTPRFLVGGAAVALVGLLLRGSAAGYLEKGQKLATHGPYRYMRNPLYLGSFVMGSGFAIAAASWTLGLAFLVFFLLIYAPVMRREEEELQRQFGGEYERYAGSVPLFFPTFLRRAGRDTSASARERFQWKRYRNNREYEAALGYIVGLVFLAAKMKLR